MSLLTRLVGKVVTKTTDMTADALNWLESIFSVKSATGINISQATAMQATAVMACVTILAEDMAKIRPRLYKQNDDGSRTEQISHPLTKLFRRPNDWCTWFEFCEMMQVGLVLRGNAFAVILRNRRGDPLMLVPINPDKVTLWEAPDGSLFFMVTRTGLHEMAVLASQPLMIPYEDMLHIRGLSANALLGISRITMAKEAIGLSLAQQELAARWAGNGAKPAGVLTTDNKLTKEAAARIREDWKALHEGLLTAGRTAVLEQGLKWQPLAMTSADLEFIASRNFQIQEIARIWRIPLHKLGDLSRSTNNNIVQQSQEYLNETLMGYVERWTSRLEFTFDLLADNMFVDYDFTRLLRADLTARYAANRIAILTGFMTINEIRRSEGMDPIEGGDDAIRPGNMLLVDTPEPDAANPLLTGEPIPPGPGSDETGAPADGAGQPADDASGAANDKPKPVPNEGDDPEEDPGTSAPGS